MSKKLFLGALAAIIAGAAFISRMQLSSAKKIIVVSGTSASGKSTITRLLQKKLGDDWVRIERDSFVSQVNMSDTEALSIVETVAKTARAQLLSKNVIVDMMFGLDNPGAATDATHDLFFSHLRDQRVLSILVYCPPTTLLQHVKMRNAAAPEDEYRSALLPFVQFATYYRPSESPTDIIIDTLSRESIKQVLTDAVAYELTHVATRERLSSEEQTKILSKMWDHGQFAHQFMVHFNLDRLSHVKIAPQSSGDVVVNSAIHTAGEIVEQIAALLTR